MQTIEFEAEVHNHSIKLPKKYSNLESKHVRVIAMEISGKKGKLPIGFYEPVQIKSYSLIASREEIHERKRFY